MHPSPKLHKLNDMAHGEVINHLNLAYPTVIEQGLFNGPFLPSGDAKNERRDGLRLLSKQPRSLPKGVLAPLPTVMVVEA